MAPVIPRDVVNSVADVEAAGSFGALPDGLYHCRLKNCEVGTTAGGDPKWTWTFEILEGEDHEGRLFFSTSTFGDKALPFLKKTIKAFGVDADDPATLAALDTDTLLGQWATLSVSTRVIPEGQKNAGKFANNVDEVLPYDGPEDPE